MKFEELEAARKTMKSGIPLEEALKLIERPDVLAEARLVCSEDENDPGEFTEDELSNCAVVYLPIIMARIEAKKNA